MFGPLERAGLRLRVFLLLAVPVLAAPIAIALAIVLGNAVAAEHGAAEGMRRLALYAGVAALFLALLGLRVWQLFDRYVAAALQRLAREVETAAQVPEGSCAALDDESLRYLGPLVPALRRVLDARHGRSAASRSDGGAHARPPAHAVSISAETRLADVLDELDSGVIVASRTHRVLLANARAHELVGAGAPLGLGRPLGDALELPGIERWLAALEGGPHEGRERPEPRASVAPRLVEPPSAHDRPPDPSHSADADPSPVASHGDPETLAGTLSPLRDAAGTIEGYVLAFDHPAVPASTPAPALASPAAAPAREPGAVRADGRPFFYDFDLFARDGDGAPDGANGTRALAALDLVVFDTETTGLEPAHGDRIVSLAAVRVVNGRVRARERFDERVDPGRPIPASATRIHGLADADVVGCPPLVAVLPRFRRFVGDAVLVAHNAAFDMKFLALETERGGVRFEMPVLDTALLSSFLHDHESDHTLDAVAARLGVAVAGRHSALGDALVTAESLVRMLPLLAARGVGTLEDALAASARQERIRRAQERAY